MSSYEMKYGYSLHYWGYKALNNVLQFLFWICIELSSDSSSQNVYLLLILEGRYLSVAECRKCVHTALKNQ
jgi:hypothetical protein